MKENACFIASYSQFHRLPQQILCIGVSKEIPDEFKTTTIRNFLYTPNSILGIGDASDIRNYNLSELKSSYINHVSQSIEKLGFHSLKEYFGKMFSSLYSLNDNTVKGICFLGFDVDDEKDSTAFIKALLQTLGYSVVKYSDKDVKAQESENIGLF